MLVFGCRHDVAIRALRRPATEKRQGTKSREVGHRLGSGRYEGLHTGELKIVQWTSRQAREVQQWTASELIDGYRFEGRQPGKTLRQLPRFGMSVAQGYF